MVKIHSILNFPRPLLPISEDVRAVDQMQVGNYALQFLWSDTHYTGIYPYLFLLAECTCIPCNQDRAAATGGS